LNIARGAHGDIIDTRSITGRLYREGQLQKAKLGKAITRTKNALADGAVALVIAPKSGRAYAVPREVAEYVRELETDD
jgi:hypothetical protein